MAQASKIEPRQEVLEKKLPQHALSRDFKAAENRRRSWLYIVPHGVTPSDMLEPDFWSHVSGQMTVYDEISAVAQDGSYDLDLRVTAVNRQGPGADVRVIRAWFNDENAVKSSKPKMEDFAVDYTPGSKWRITRVKDKKIVREGIENKLEAEAYITVLCN